jgi:hypothetical protein
MPETKKNNDYSNSADITNSPAVKDLLEKYLIALCIGSDLQAKVKLATADLQLQIAANESAADFYKQIKEAVNGLGSYQNVDAGHYAVKQRQLHRGYDADAFVMHFPGHVPSVIDYKPVINMVSLTGLVNAGKITDAALKEKAVIKETETFRWVIQ